jgi:outer membrane lipoprotein-sorting protein
MKKLFFLLSALLVASVCSAQTLDEIINHYYAANGVENLEKANTVYVEAKANQMGMEIPMVINVKKPNKVKMVMTFQGMEMVTLFDGEKGYMINPMTGSTDPVEIPAEQLSGIEQYNMLRDNLMEAYKGNRIKLEGDGEVNGKPAFKLAVTDAEGNVTTTFIDKESYLVVKTVQTVSQMGQEMEVESYVKDYMDINGIKFPKTITQVVSGSEMGGITFEKVEIDKLIDDSVFTIK